MNSDTPIEPAHLKAPRWRSSLKGRALAVKDALGSAAGIALTMLMIYGLGMLMAVSLEFEWTPPTGKYSEFLGGRPQPKPTAYIFFPAVWLAALIGSLVWLWNAATKPEKSLASTLGMNRTELKLKVRSPWMAARLGATAIVWTIVVVSILVAALALGVTGFHHYLGTSSGDVHEYGRLGSMHLTTSFVSNCKILWYEVVRTVPVVEFDQTFSIDSPPRPDTLYFNLVLMITRLAAFVLPASAVLQIVDVWRGLSND